MKLTERLGKEWIFFDGGMGTILQEHGLKAGELPETWNLSHPDEIIALNRSYFEVGCDVVNTNTFGANALKYPDNLQEIVQAAVSHAKTARQQAGREDAYIALDIGPTGKLLQPMGDLPFERAVELFGETIRIGAAAGADLVLIETMSDSYEAKAAVLAAKENCDLPVLVTLIFDEKGKLLTGGTVDSTVAMLEGLRVDALGVNCGLGPKQMHPIIERLTQVSSLPIIVNPNAGLPRSENGKTVFDIAPAEFSDLMEEIAGMGVQALGGCCGTTPEHLRLTIEKNRYAISLKKAIGFCSRDIKRSYWIRGFLPAFFGIVTGIFLGNICGEKLCGSILTSFGAEGFSFVTDWRMVCFLIPVTLSFAAVAAVEAGIWEIKNIRAFECCIGKE